MELKEFIKSTLTAVHDAVEQLQSTGSSNYNPTFKFSVDKNKDIRGILAHGSYNYSLVEFDVAVTAERSGR